MLSKPNKILSYSALTVTLLVGNITTPTSFFEDDENFATVPNQLSTGWEFSFNKNFATCGSGSDPDVCPDDSDEPPEEDLDFPPTPPAIA